MLTYVRLVAGDSDAAADSWVLMWCPSVATRQHEQVKRAAPGLGGLIANQTALYAEVAVPCWLARPATGEASPAKGGISYMPGDAK